MSELWKVEFHCHTIWSPDSLNRIPALIARAQEQGIQRLIVTDHNTIRGALEAQAAWPEGVIVGEEVQTTHGEFLAAFVTEEVPKRLEPLEALRRLRDQGAFISLSHPFDPARSGWSEADLEWLRPQVDAMEVFNARCNHPSMNEKAQAYADRFGLAGTVGSDAHTLAEVGTAVLELPPFATAEELRAVIRQGRAITRYSSPMVHFGSSYARIAKHFGWVRRD